MISISNETVPNQSRAISSTTKEIGEMRGQRTIPHPSIKPKSDPLAIANPESNQTQSIPNIQKPSPQARLASTNSLWVPPIAANTIFCQQNLLPQTLILISKLPRPFCPEGSILIGLMPRLPSSFGLQNLTPAKKISFSINPPPPKEITLKSFQAFSNHH
eukprot:TRINITY_DN17627_c0_g1_i1.p1 TRINITY_DN17627_c0_g1~~TRINITY_DN17627_c0_g1_i1.p1  ORF type:complete len:160 (+),score=23.69 TRINITY_DN17627_c0_g1_i1:1617-2096(+)